VRVIVKALGRTFDMEFARDEDAPPLERDTAIHAETERAIGWDHDTRPPVGFRRHP
jgi:hypothetical protein